MPRLRFAVWLLLLHLVAGSVHERIAEMRDRLQHMVVAFSHVSQRGEGGVFETIRGFADDAEEVLRVTKDMPAEEQLQALEAAMELAKDEWMSALTEAQTKLGVRDEAPELSPEDHGEGLLQQMQEQMQELKAAAAAGTIDKQQLLQQLERLRDLAAAQPGAEAEAKEVETEQAELDDLDTEKGRETIAAAARLLQKATRDGLVEKVHGFLQKLSDPRLISRVIDWQDGVGATALHWCAFYGSKDHAVLAQAYVAMGANLTKGDNHGRTACHTACLRGHSQVLEALSRGCDPMALSGEGSNCAHLAASRGDAHLLELLVRLGALNQDNVNLPTSTQSAFSPLWLAVDSGSVRSVEVLLLAGARAKGEKPSVLDLAESHMEKFAGMMSALDPDWEDASSSKRAEL